MNNPSAKTKAIIAYITFIGLLIAISMNQEKKEEYTIWHIKNMFGLLIILFIAVALQNSFVGFYIYWTCAVFWLFSLIMAIVGRKKGIPFLSEKFQQWFTFLG